MAGESGTWRTLTPDRPSWEVEGQTYLRTHPGVKALRAWSSFEFTTHEGATYTVPLLLLTGAGLYLIDIYGWSGTITGDATAWTIQHDGRERVIDNPSLLANKKAKLLAGLLEAQPGMRKQVPFVASAVFLSSEDVTYKLDDVQRLDVFLRDEVAGPRSPYLGIVQALDGGRLTKPGKVIMPAVEKALVSAVESAGFKRMRRTAEIKDHVLDASLGDGPGYQDWLGHHAKLETVQRRIRIYLVARDASPEERARVRRAANRDFELVHSLSRPTCPPGILRPIEFYDHELHPAVLFDHDPGSMRLDLFRQQYGDGLSLGERLRLFRQLAETLRFAHGRKVLHRALSPQTIEVQDPALPTRQLKIVSWQTGARADATTGTAHLQELVEDASTAYIAPETFVTARDADESGDVFSLGAVGYFLFTGHAPAANHLDLLQHLVQGKGLRPSAVANGIDGDLDDLIAACTDPNAAERLHIEEVLVFLESIEERIREPEEKPVDDLADAKAGALLQGYRVLKRLGGGATSEALLAEKDAEEVVLKFARDAANDEYLRAEAEVLRKLSHKYIVPLYDDFQVGERTCLVLGKAGDRHLGQRLSEEGRLHVDLLRRFGDDLLRAVAYLEGVGVHHRDIKPANLGVRKIGRGDELHLMLFDFSLSRASADNIGAGTVGYLDPFLSILKPPRWDLHAERYAVAATLYEMASGKPPKWGDGRSNPALVPCELSLEADKFDPSLRDSLSAFFRKALHRDRAQRFDNAEDMRAAWTTAMQAAATAAAPSGGHDRTALAQAVSQADLETSVAALSLSPGACEVLDRRGALTVRELLGLPEAVLRYERNVPNRTRRELLDVVAQLRQRFPTVDVPPEVIEREREEAARAGQELLGVDLIASVILEGKTTQAALRDAYLGVGELAAQLQGWPAVRDLAARLPLPLPAAIQAIERLRKSWRSQRSILLLRDTVSEILDANGGVMSAPELADAVLTARGALSNDADKRRRLAGAITRVAVEVEQSEASPRYLLRRADDSDRVLVAKTDALADYALRLGDVADRLAAEDPLAPPQRVLDDLRAVPGGDAAVDLAPHRLVRLAAACSTRAAASSRQELYPRGMDGRRALVLAHGALLGAQELHLEDVQARVASRYPEAQPLPGRPALDDLLAEAGWDFKWEAETGRYRRPLSTFSVTSGSALLRYETASGSRGTVTPAVAEARAFDERLGQAYRGGGYVVLMVQPRLMEPARHELTRAFDLEIVDVDAVLIEAMHARATEKGANWATVLKADVDRTRADWKRLVDLVSGVMERVEQDLMRPGRRILVVNPGLLARYDQMEVLGRLRDRAGNADGPQVAWVLDPCDERHDLPTLDGRAVPTISPAQRARIPLPWVQNVHRSRTTDETAVCIG